MKSTADCPDCLPYGTCEMCGRRADEITAAEFAAWMERRGLNTYTAAPLLAATQSEVARWSKGTRKVSRRVARIMELLDTLDAERVPSCGP